MKEYRELIPEITLKFKKEPGVHKVQIRNSSDSFELFKRFYDEDTVQLCETVIVLYLDNNHKSIGWFKVSQGGITETCVDMRLILGTALKCGATAMILSHNHPSGNSTPSAADAKVTDKLNSACKLLDLKLLDHIIVSGELDQYYSFADNGQL